MIHSLRRGKLKYVLGQVKYVDVFFQLWSRYGFRRAWKFLLMKLFVKEGEGALGVLFRLGEYLLTPLGKTHWLCRYPRQIEIEVTNVCDKKCILCEHTYWEEPARHLKYDEFLKIIDQFPDLLWVNMTGEGDSFLNPDYIRMLSTLKDRDVPVYLVDSFNRLTPDKANALLDMGIDGIHISFDGATKETYEKVKVGCNYEQTIQNIRYLLAARGNRPFPEICFRYVITTFNVNEMPGFIDMIYREFGEYNIGHIEFVGLLYFPETKQYFVDRVPDEIIDEVYKRGEKYGYTVRLAHPGAALPSRRHCTAWSEPYFMMGGYVLSCCAVLMSNRRPALRRLAYGNINDKPFRDIWNSRRYRWVRENVNKEDSPMPHMCRGCRAYEDPCGES